VVPQANIDTRLATKDLVIMGKYRDPNAVGAYASNNIYLLRYADAYLIAAEAEARKQRCATETAYANVDINAENVQAISPAHDPWLVTNRHSLTPYCRKGRGSFMEKATVGMTLPVPISS
jgi:hypothetical protein